MTWGPLHSAERFPSNENIFAPQQRQTVRQGGVSNHVTENNRFLRGIRVALFTGGHFSQARETICCDGNQSRYGDDDEYDIRQAVRGAPVFIKDPIPSSTDSEKGCEVLYRNQYINTGEVSNNDGGA